jgi:DNA end-binding protein Ku
MRSIWKGSISFGLVSIPVKLYSATEEKDISFRQVHREDGGRIKYQRVCTKCGEEVSYSDIAKGYEMDDGSIVVLTDEDLASVPLSSSRAIDVLQFVPLDQVDPIYFNRSYYLEPDKAGVKSYVLLAQALEESGQVAVVKVALRQREALAALRVRDGVFVLETMLWPDEIRTPDFGFLDDDVDVRKAELAMAGTLIESLSGDFDPEAYHDEYREALESVIEAKIEGHEVVAPAEERPAAAGVVDLMSALRASVEAAKERQAGRAAKPAKADTPAKAAKKAGGKSAAKQAGGTKSGTKSGTKAGTQRAEKAAKPAKKPAAKAAARKSA